MYVIVARGENVVVDIIVGTLLFLIIGLAGWSVYFYSNMLNKKTIVKEAWQQFYGVLIKRDALIEQLLELQGNTHQGNSLLSQLAEARDAFMIAQSFAEIMQADRETRALLAQLSNNALNCFSACSTDKAKKLYQTLFAIEQDIIPLQQRLYNNAIGRHNAYLQSCPNSIVAKVIGAKLLPLYVGNIVKTPD